MKLKALAVPHWPIVKQALAIAWRHKALWLLGLFAILADVGGVFESVIKALPVGDELGGLVSYGTWLDRLVPANATWLALGNAMAMPSAATVAMAVLTVVTSLLLVLLLAGVVTAAIAGAVYAVGILAEGRRVTLGQSLRRGLVFFWPVLALIVAMKIVTALTLGVASASLNWLVHDGRPAAAVAFLTAFIIFGVVSVVISLLTVMGLNEVIHDHRRLGEAVPLAWQRLRRHWLAALELAGLLLLVNIAVFLLALLAVMVLAVPIILLIALFSYLNLNWAVTLLMAGTDLLIVAAVVSAAGLVGITQLASWNIFWQRLGHHSILHRLGSWMEGWLKP